MDSTGDVQDVKTKMEFAVEMKTPCCVDKVKKVVAGFKDIHLVSLDLKSQRLMVEGGAAAETVKTAIEEATGMATVVMGQGSDENLGAGVAAISFSDHGVIGLLRLVQNSPSSCVIDGTVDNLPLHDTVDSLPVDSLPPARPVFLSLHETGNVSHGCHSCGHLFTSGKMFDGILARLSPDDQHRAEFRVNTTGVKLSDMIGRCVVVHQGERDDVIAGRSDRLACGIVARASGLFQNPKRFCACDGVTIWEQKESEKCCKSRPL